MRTKAALYAYCEKTYPTADDYIAAYCRISETLDNMRIVYSNVGETDELIGLYPYAPLHDMRRALQTIDLTLETREVVERFRGGALALAADVAAGGALVGAVDLAQRPTRVRARLRGAARNEYRLPVPAAPAPRFAHRCTADSALAQAFTLPRGDALVGVDLLVGPRTAALKGNVAFHADDGGLPAATPFAAVALDPVLVPGQWIVAATTLLSGLAYFLAWFASISAWDIAQHPPGGGAP